MSLPAFFLFQYIFICFGYLGPPVVINELLFFSCSILSNSLRPMDCSTAGFLVLFCLPEFAQTHVHWDSDAIQLSYPVIPFSSCPQSFPTSGSFPIVDFLHYVAKYWSFNFSISPSNSGLISFKIDWFDLLAVQGTLKESSPAPQFESINSSVLSLLYSSTLTSIHD